MSRTKVPAPKHPSHTVAVTAPKPAARTAEPVWFLDESDHQGLDEKPIGHAIEPAPVDERAIAFDPAPVEPFRDVFDYAKAAKAELDVRRPVAPTPVWTAEQVVERAREAVLRDPPVRYGDGGSDLCDAVGFAYWALNTSPGGEDAWERLDIPKPGCLVTCGDAIGIVVGVPDNWPTQVPVDQQPFDRLRVITCSQANDEKHGRAVLETSGKLFRSANTVFTWPRNLK